MTKTLRLTIDIEIDDTGMEFLGKNLLDVAASLRLYDHDLLDGFHLVRETDDIAGYEDFLLKNASLLKIENVTTNSVSNL